MSDIPGAHNRLWHPELAKRDEKVKPKCRICGGERIVEPVFGRTVKFPYHMIGKGCEPCVECEAWMEADE